VRYLNLSKREIILGKIQQFFADITILEYFCQAESRAKKKRNAYSGYGFDDWVHMYCQKYSFGYK